MRKKTMKFQIDEKSAQDIMSLKRELEEQVGLNLSLSSFIASLVHMGVRHHTDVLGINQEA
jgi:hypothetical protein